MINQQNIAAEQSQEGLLSRVENVEKQLRDFSTPNKTIGSLGEEYTSIKLMLKNWILLDRNWHSRFGELDVVMMDILGTIVFIEVKTRRSVRFGTPLEAVTEEKRIKTHKAAFKWLEDHKMFKHRRIRFDVVSILISKNKNIQIQHILGAF
ncbi:YraN family protein [Gardnerella vaginalis]|uniref:YraN family protein n=1 Tax=Gardnerella vaginalis TaxID=2702 RepID=UPI0039EF5C95